MIFDLLTSPQGCQFDRRVNILIAFCSALHPGQFDMSHNHVRKNKILIPWAHPASQSFTPGA